MELLEGQTLRRRMDGGALGWREAARIGATIADGLSAAHLKGIIHRDLKPENVVLTADDSVKILDFGLALHRLSMAQGAEVQTTARTAPGVVLGTFGYMAPEQVTGEPVDGRSDIFAAGCLIYEMLTGRRLFEGVTPQELIATLLHDSLPDLSAIDPAAPSALRGIVSRCVDREPTRRFSSANDLAMALRALLTSSTERPAAARRPRPRGKSLAILPFVNSGADPQIEYLTDGITESIISSLSQLPGLRVVPRSLAFRSKGLQSDPSTVGLALNARTILTGHVVQHADMLHIQAELVDTATESQLWGERFRQKTSDLLLVQEEIAWQISEALRLKLTGEQKKRLRKRPTVNPDAYQEYLRGRYHWHSSTPGSATRAVEHFEKALEYDAGYALAYAGLGNAFGALAYYGHVAPQDGFPRARAAALQALEFDDRLADAHITLALERLFYAWDWPGADAAVERAMALDPDSAIGHEVRSIWYISCGRFDEAVAAARRARALDPLSPFINMGVAWILHFFGRPLEAIRELLDVLALKPGLEEAGSILIAAYESLGRFDEAIAVIAQQRCWGFTLDAPALIAAHGRGGAEGYWQERLAQMRRTPSLPPTMSYVLAVVYCRLGEWDMALDHLERMVDNRVGRSVFIGVDASFKCLRGLPRFEALVSRVGAPQPHTASAPHTAST